MRLPFGLDLVSVLVGIALAYFVIPWLTGMLNRNKTAPTA
jgi:hypothetical protein